MYRHSLVLLVLSSLSHSVLLPHLHNKQNDLQRPLIESPISEDVPVQDNNIEELPLIDSQKLQDDISADALLASAEHLFKIAEFSLPEYNHPTRVIGSAGSFYDSNFDIYAK